MDNQTYKIFISSPGGLEVDRSIIIDEINKYSASKKNPDNCIISVVKWPENIGAGAAEYGQSVINRQTKKYDILICLVGARMGTPTPRANSGTEEEFDRAMEGILSGRSVQILLFFNNLPIRPQEINPNQLLLVRAFQEKATRLGVLYHIYDTHEQLRALLKVSLHEALNFLINKKNGSSKFSPHIAVPENEVKSISIEDFTLNECVTAPQWVATHVIPLSSYRRNNIKIKLTLRTSSNYLRFGFKYYDSREQIISTGTVQTIGQNILVHIGKNCGDDDWFLTAYRAGYRVGENRCIENTKNLKDICLQFSIFKSGIVNLKFNSKMIYEEYFKLDGLPSIALMAWGDEHRFSCQVQDINLIIS